MNEARRYRAAVLGATGVVGMRIAALLAGHPMFEVVMLAASGERAGADYLDAVSSRPFGSDPALARYRGVRLAPPDPAAADGLDVAFDALPASVSREVVPRFLAAGVPVSSNASAFRSDPAVPLLLPDVNPDHLELLHSPVLAERRRKAGWNAPLVANPNCVVAGLAAVLAPLRPLGLSDVTVVTFQALSGAGFPGVPSLSALGNVLPRIPGEEEKIGRETAEILGRPTPSGPEPWPVEVEASCARVPVPVGHLMSVTLSLPGASGPRDVLDAWAAFPGADLPSAPARPVRWVEGEDRPQPALDLGDGMSVAVGRLRRLSTGRYSFFALVDNLVRGAAGAAVMNAELLAARGLLG